MQKRAILVLSGGFLLSSPAALLSLSRQRALEDRIAALEGRVPSMDRTAPGRPSPPAPAPPEPDPVSATPPPERRTETFARHAAVPTADALTPAQREAVAKEVERQMRERGPAFAVEALQDPVALLEKELGLSPSQKLRVAEHWKQRVADQRKLMGVGTFKEGPDESDGAIRRELDFPQQERYDTLKREGRLFSGMMIRIEAGPAEKK